jgi:carbon starvation protein CstA
MWLLKRGKKHLLALIPGIFMFITTIASLVVILAKDYIPKRNYMLATGDVLLIFLSVGVAVLVVKSFRRRPAA